jgi:6-phosphogluconate dehydrogenase
MTPQLGVIGLGTMGANLARNAAGKGADVVVYNRTAEKTEIFMNAYGKEGSFVATSDVESFVGALSAPRKILLMVKAGEAVDAVIAELQPHLEKGDILIDGGNSHYRDTEKRIKALEENGVHFVGMGISGGEEGALHGPSLMPGGSKEAYKKLEPLLTLIAADDGEGGKCVAHMGPGGAGHFVKMVHNGIEYAFMQLIAESYHLLKEEKKLDSTALSKIFAKWNKSPQLSSFLLEITAAIFAKKDKEAGVPLIERIKDAAGQKGTGKWTTEAALSYGVSVPTITAAVDARIVSSAKDFRLQQSSRTSLNKAVNPVWETFEEDVCAAFELSLLNAFAQGFQMLSVASEEEKWNIPVPEVIRCWQGGCIIRTEFLKTYREAFAGDADAGAAIRDRFSVDREIAWRKIVAHGALRAIPLPSTSSALSYYDSYRTADLPQNLIQAQRDFFGAHQYERTDKSGVFHTEWNA